MEEFEYEDDWDEEEEEDEEEGWGLSKEEIAKRLQQVNQEQDKREAKKEEQKEKKRGRKKGTKNKTRKEKKKKDPNAPPKSKRSKRQGLKLLLIRDYLYNEASEDKPKSTEAIMDYLKENYDIEATDRTIHTDVKRLREDANVPVIYNRHRRGYYIDERPYSPAELRLIIDCIRNAEFLTKEDAATLTEKIMGLASSPDKELLAHQLEEEYRKSQTEASVIENVGLLMKAIDAGRKVSFNRYRYVAERTKHTSLEAEVIIASPIKLIRKSNQYILEYAIDFKNGSCIFDKIQVAMMDNVEILNVANSHTKAEKRARQQSMEDVLDAINGKKRAITLLIYNRASEKILSNLPEDAILIKVNNVLSKTTILERASPQFFSMLDSFGNYAKILEPQDVVEKFLQWQKQKVYDYARLYKVNLEDIPVSEEEPGGLSIK
ncbi:MAG: WYL domain-containing protein [Oscillospiraceae bacterium]|nr:WYL domain-containing protein [Oscillospiraceae bacterium]